jgi:hypothetical protein
MMFHGFDYPGEIGKDEFAKRLWREAKMKDGIVEFPRPDDSCLIRQDIRPMTAAKFKPGHNFTALDNDPSVIGLLEKEGQA